MLSGLFSSLVGLGSVYSGSDLEKWYDTGLVAGGGLLIVLGLVELIRAIVARETPSDAA